MSAEQIQQLQVMLHKMQVTLDAIADAVVWIGTDACIQWCNSGFEVLVNQTRTDICGSQLHKLLPLMQLGKPVAVNAYPDMLMLRGEYETADYELYISGNSRELQISGIWAGFSGDKCAVLVIRDITRTKQDIVGITRDIHDRKQTEAALQRRAQAEGLLSSISRQFIDQDLDTAIDFTLQAIAQFMDAERACIHEWSDNLSGFYISHEWYAATATPLIGDARGSSGDKYGYAYHLLLRGNYVNIPCIADLPDELPEKAMLAAQSAQSILLVPMIHSGKAVGFVGVDTMNYCKHWTQEDINFLTLVGEIIAIGCARYQAEKEMRVAKDAAETANKAKSAFLAHMSHELRTPLNIILGFVQLMNRDVTLNPKQRQFLATINRSGEHLLNLINDVLEMSKIEAGHIKFQPKSFDLHLLLATLQEMFQVQIQAKQLWLKFEIAADVPQYIHTDAGKLRQILINLLSNAIKFTQVGGVTLRVTTNINLLNNSTVNQKLILRFEVIDTGVGIAPAEIDKLFQPFIQTMSGIQTTEGTGLGLAISSQFVNLMGGNIKVVSNLGKGSTFSFDIQANLVETLVFTPPSSQNRIFKLAPNQPNYVYTDKHSETITDQNLANIESTILYLRSHLSDMSGEWLAELYHAANAVDGEKILQLIKQIPQNKAKLSEKMTDLVQHFCFDEILDLTEKLLPLQPQ
jgi:signal transduction histidine kinase/PAS domain-containing protein